MAKKVRDRSFSSFNTWLQGDANYTSQTARIYQRCCFLLKFYNSSFISIADGLDEGGEEDYEDDFEQVLADYIDRATQKR